VDIDLSPNIVDNVVCVTKLLCKIAYDEYYSFLLSTLFLYSRLDDMHTGAPMLQVKTTQEMNPKVVTEYILVPNLP